MFGRMTYAAHVGLQLGHTLVLWCVEDHGEVVKVLLSIHWIVDL